MRPSNDIFQGIVYLSHFCTCLHDPGKRCKRMLTMSSKRLAFCEDRGVVPAAQLKLIAL